MPSTERSGPIGRRLQDVARGGSTIPDGPSNSKRGVASSLDSRANTDDPGRLENDSRAAAYRATPFVGSAGDAVPWTQPA